MAYITTRHESLLALLPPDTTCADLFGEVENQRPIASFFLGHPAIFRVRYIPFMVGGRQGVWGGCSGGRPPDRPQCMGVCLKCFSGTQSYPDNHLFGILHRFLREDVVKKNKMSCSSLSSGVRCADVAGTIRGAVRVIGNLLASGRALRLSVSKCEQHVKAGVQGSRFACCS